jgi:hypothetical protein
MAHSVWVHGAFPRIEIQATTPLSDQLEYNILLHLRRNFEESRYDKRQEREEEIERRRFARI